MGGPYFFFVPEELELLDDEEELEDFESLEDFVSDGFVSEDFVSPPPPPPSDFGAALFL